MLGQVLQACLLVTILVNASEVHLESRDSLLTEEITPSFIVDVVASKSKVEGLGDILKKHVQMLRRVPGQSVDLVFLVDSSASVGAENFFNELKFVKKLLADFAVSYNQTRVAIITFSSRDKVIRHIDHVTQASLRNHKCSLLEVELPRIRYTGGGTYTLGALLEAQSVLALARERTVKAIFLITDGYSNGGDPRPAAEFLKSRGVSIFTFGIRNGNIQELQDMASQPKDEHSYILDSFEEFEALARRALHEDLHSGVFVVQDPTTCAPLCKDRRYCCDVYATCTCGTHTGRYSCVCKPGYYGSGLVGDCRPCPVGTYRETQGPGTLADCKPCPDHNMHSKPGSTSALQCYCKQGYKQMGDKCHIRQCPALRPPEKGYFVKNKCNNLVNVACGIKCQTGYRLEGSSIRLCQEDGMWSGTDAECVMKSCSHLEAPIAGTMMCSKKDLTIDTECHFACNSGFKLVGSKMRTCLPVAKWDGIPAFCKPIFCPPLSSLLYGRVKPSTCVSGKSKIGASCEFICDRGYELSGPLRKTCIVPGIWTESSQSPRCIDIEPPKIQCPADINIAALPTENYAEVMWGAPFVKDNSKIPVLLSTIPATTIPMKLKIGIHEVTYIAEDSWSNKASCSFKITVEDITPPVIHWCDSPPTFLSSEEEVDVYWEEPMFSDNSGDDVQVERSHNPGKLPQGETVVQYVAEDKTGNIATCNITIVVQITSKASTVTRDAEIAMNDEEGSVCDDLFYMSQIERHLEQKLEDALNKMCSNDVVCEVAAVEAICESILEENENRIENSINNFRKKREDSDISALYWPDSEDGNWLIWNRDAGVVSRLKRSIKLDRYQRPKRQFSFLTTVFKDNFFSQPNEEKDEGAKLGPLVDIVTRSFGSDIGLSRFASFLEDLRKDSNVFKTSDFFGAFAKEFGDEKSEHLKELVQQKFGRDFGEKKLDSDLFSISENASIVPSDLEKLQIFGGLLARSQVQEKGNSSKAIKIKFKVAGRGDQAEQSLNDVMEGVLSSAQEGQFDLSFAEKQLKVAAIRLSEDPEYVCDAGSVSQADLCVKCPVGTFFNVIRKECQSCPVGSFQPNEGQVSCLVCPDHTSTKNGQAKSYADCRAQCLPGSYSLDGIEPCTTCAFGEYQDEYSSTSCTSCPFGSTTWRRGAWVIEECKPSCGSGYISETGLEPCLECPVGYFQHDAQQSHCFKCPMEAVTDSSGSASILQCKGVSEENEAAFSNLETLQINDCFSMPCRNLATCSPMKFGYTCHCLPGYTGQQCETEINECTSDPCYNGADCINQINGFKCDCMPGFNGSMCERDIDECNPNPCQNGAFCLDFVDGFSCDCPTGFTGEICDTNIDECSKKPCINGANCTDLLNDYKCNCVKGFEGRHCEIEINECDSSPCANGACHDFVGGFKCHCTDGFAGDTCEINVDECASNPCKNGAVCEDWINGFSCWCLPGFSGSMCESEMSTKFVLSFKEASIFNFIYFEHFPRELSEVSLSLWMRSFDKENYGTPFSYSTQDHDNAFTLTDYNGFVVYVNGEKRITDISANDGKWHFIVVTWKSDSGVWAFYLDGRLADSGSGLAAGSVIIDDGVMVLGQEQDALGGKYNPQESFIGDLYLVNLWDKILSPSKVRDLHNTCERYVGSVMAWPDFQKGVKGKISLGPSTFCHGCGIPTIPGNGILSQITTDPGDVIEVVCNKGYKLFKGDKTRKCLIEGVWSGNEPFCAPVSCGHPGVPLNAEAKGNGVSFGDVIKFVCYPRFRLIGESELQCLEDGKWSASLPSCEIIKCPEPDVIVNGAVISGLSAYLPSNHVLYTCQTGYQMDGRAIRMCGRNGDWHGDTPSCIPMSCSERPEIDNSDIESKLEVAEGDTLKVSCHEGYELKGPTYITCNENGNWNIPLPKCINKDCEDPPHVRNGLVEVSSESGKLTAMYTCNEGFDLIGKEILECENGKWSRPFSRCRGLPCPTPNPPQNGFIKNDTESWSVGNMVEYECIEGFSLVGEKSSVCRENAEWEINEVRCEHIICGGIQNIPNGYYTVVSLPESSEILSGLVLERPEGELVIGRKRRFSTLSNGSPDFERFDFSQSSHDSADFDTFGHDFSQSPQSSYDSLDFDNYGQQFSQSVDYGQSIFGSDYFGQTQSGSDYPQLFTIEQLSQSSSSDEIGDSIIEVAKEYFYETKIEYACNPGYQLIGDFQRVCTSNATWSSPEPRCYEMYCSKLENIENGFMEYFGSGLNSRVEYECNEGYVIDGDFELICELGHSWSDSPPKCKPIDCLEPPDIGNGTVAFDSTLYGSIATYDCFFGFVLEGSFDRFCGEYGRWNGTMPKCIEITCNVPPVIENGYITFEGSLFAGSPIEYECKDCFELVGPRLRHCQVDGEWDLYEPVCNLIKCDPLHTTFDNGQIFNNESICDSIIEFSCNPGYNIIGSPETTCLSDKTWSSSPPVCERISCGTPKSINNGYIVGDSYRFSDKVTFECNVGYVLKGSNIIVCQETGLWSFSSAFCLIKNCTKPQGPSNGRVRLSGLYYGASADVVCDDGYKLIGDRKLMCSADGKWDKEMPHCLPVICPPAPQVPYAFYNSSELQFEAFTNLFYECISGYFAKNHDNFLLCNSKGLWVGELIKCLPVNCGPPIAPTNGKVVGSNFTFGATVNFKCSVGYELIGESVSECEYNGMWSRDEVSCQKIKCPRPKTVEFAKVFLDPEERTFGSAVRYVCNTGYYIVGNEKIVCEEDGDWSSSFPECKPVLCLEPPESINANILGKVFEFPNSIEYKCEEGYQLKGDSVLICQSDATWSSEFPVCEEITCDVPDELEHGKWILNRQDPAPLRTESSKKEKSLKSLAHDDLTSKLAHLIDDNNLEKIMIRFKDVIDFICEEGYELTSGEYLSCTENGWNSTIPSCNIITCPSPVNIQNGIIIKSNITFGSVIKYRCNEGYKLVGPTRRTCQSNKMWSEDEPSCIIVECSTPSLLINGIAQWNSFDYKAIISYSCNSGFRISGVNTRVCQSNGYWSDQKPECVEVFCPNPEEVENSVINFSLLKVGSTAAYSCNEGYQLSGNNKRVCQDSGVWSASLPTCTLIDCGEPSLSLNVITGGHLTAYGSIMIFFCEPGYRMIGQDWAACLNTSRWSNPSPMCELITCPAPEPPTHGFLKRGFVDNIMEVSLDQKRRKRTYEYTVSPVLQEYTVNDSISFECELGFQLKGEATLLCTESGTWSAVVPKCIKISCGVPFVAKFTQADGKIMTYGGVFTYKCKEGYTLHGPQNITCLGNGSWSQPTPFCKPNKCGTPPTPEPEIGELVSVPGEHGMHGHFGSYIQYSCPEGYTMEGQDMMVCGIDGFWEGTPPACIEILCTDPADITYARVDVDNAARPQVAQYACDMGYVPMGNASIVCLNGTWSYSSFSCTPVTCYEPFVPPRAKITSSKFTFNSIANYSCVEGYRLQGNAFITCGAVGKWIGDIPSCYPVDCGQPEFPENGVVGYTSTDLNSLAVYSCKAGHVLKGLQRRVCSPSGSWSGDLPQCFKKDCGEIEPPPHGFVMGVGTHYGDQVKFSCDVGYTLIGGDTTVCTEEGRWSFTAPLCRAMECGYPPLLLNGHFKEQPKYSFRNRIAFKCKDGFIARGELSIVCLETGMWSQLRGQCSRMSCERPTIGKGGAIIHGRSFHVGDTVSFSCPPGQESRGALSAKCLPDGSWSDLPECISKCSRKCINGGVCLNNYKCSCPPGFTGNRCQKAICPLPCLHNGVCVAPYKCKCRKGYSGSRCQDALCPRGCGETGRCISPNVCLCGSGSYNSQCIENDYEYDQKPQPAQTNPEDWDVAKIRHQKEINH